MNQTNTNQRTKFWSILKPFFWAIFFILLIFILAYYFLASRYGEVYPEVFRAYLYASPIFVMIGVIPYLSKEKFSWAPISLCLYTGYCIFAPFFNYRSTPYIFIILMGIAVVLDFSYFYLNSYIDAALSKKIQRVILIIVLSIYIVSSVELLSGLFANSWRATPFDPYLDSIYIPFTIIIVSIGFLHYLFLVVAPFESGNKKLLRIITSSVFCTAFVLTLIMMIIPII